MIEQWQLDGFVETYHPDYSAVLASDIYDHPFVMVVDRSGDQSKVPDYVGSATVQESDTFEYVADGINWLIWEWEWRPEE